MRAKYLLLLVIGVLIGMGLQGVLAKGEAKVIISWRRLAPRHRSHQR